MDTVLSSVTAATGNAAIPLTQSVEIMRFAIMVLVFIVGALLLSAIVFTIVSLVSKKQTGIGSKVMMAGLYLAAIVAVICTVLCFGRYRLSLDLLQAQATAPTTVQTEPTTVPTEPETEPTVPTEPEVPFVPAHVDVSNPENWQIDWQVIVAESIAESFARTEPITFEKDAPYTALEGIVTFRGDNFRSGPTYGTATVTEETVTEKWSRGIGSLNGWPGSGWTGQPLIVRWDDNTKQIMNLYAEKKEKSGLVEVILATLDGYIYFYDLEDGSYTRDPLYVGMNFKGAGALDPRGYPLMYVGSGDVFGGKSPRMYIISLIDTTILYEGSGYDDFAKRGWNAFDSSPLVDAQTDTLIWPGENGMLYTIKLNTAFDPAAGTVSIAPEQTARTRYTTSTGRTVGFESSCVAVDGFLYVGDNGGLLFCVDLNTMQVVWAVDTKDDINATPVFEWGEDKNGYLYVGTSMEFNRGTSTLYKLNAQTGEIIWSKEYTGILYDKAVSGGVLSSPILGKAGTELEGLIIHCVAKTPNPWKGVLVALNTETGEVVWELELDNYSWSSPAPIYTDTEKAYVLICDAVGTVRLVSGKTGEVLSTVSLGSNIEASPAVFEGTAVIGTRGQKVFGLQIG